MNDVQVLDRPVSDLPRCSDRLEPPSPMGEQPLPERRPRVECQIDIRPDRTTFHYSGDDDGLIDALNNVYGLPKPVDTTTEAWVRVVSLLVCLLGLGLILLSFKDFGHAQPSSQLSSDGSRSGSVTGSHPLIS